MEDRYLWGPHVCSECGDKERAKVGCKKPGFDVECTQPTRFESPMLRQRAEREGVDPDTYCLLKECPTGAVMREAPYLYDIISVQSYAENGALNPLDLSPWAQSAIRMVGAEKSRLMDAKREMDTARSRSKRAMNAHLGANRG